MYNQTSTIIFSHNPNFEFIYGDVRDEEKLLPYIQMILMLLFP